MFIVIIISLMLFTFISYGLISHYLTKSHIKSSIQKKFEPMGYEILSIDKIEPPKFLEKFEEHSQIVMDYGGGPKNYIYKSVEIKDIHGKKYKGVIVAKKLFALTISINYYFDLDNSGYFQLLK